MHRAKMTVQLNILLVFAFYFIIAVSASRPSQLPLVVFQSEHSPRGAIEDDLDDIVTAFIAAWKSNPAWEYVHNDDKKYANYTWDCTRKALQEQWENLDAEAFVNVISVPRVRKRSDERSERVVSLAAWSWLKPEDFERHTLTSRLHPLIPFRGGCSKNLDVNETRAEYIEQQFEGKAEPYIRDLAEPQLYLGMLFTHPDWDGHGFGAAQLQVGLEKAEQRRTPVTLISTPAGYPLYDSLGFRSLANVTFDKLDDEGILSWAEYMRWDADKG